MTSSNPAGLDLFQSLYDWCGLPNRTEFSIRSSGRTAQPFDHLDEIAVARRWRFGVTGKRGDQALLVITDLPGSCGLPLRVRVGEIDEIAAHQPAGGRLWRAQVR